MAYDAAITPSDNNVERKRLVREQLANTEVKLAPTDIQLDVSNAVKIPFDALSELGVCLSPIATTFRTAATTIDTPTLLSVTDKFGNALDPHLLQSFKDGSGYLGSYRDATNGFGQARLHPVEGQTLSSVASMPYDPTALFIAAAMAQINAKLDAIQAGVDKIYRYEEIKDEAERRSNLDALQRYLNGYKHNWNNATWIASAHNQVASIKREAEKSIIQLRALIGEETQKGNLLEVRASVEGKLDNVVKNMREYQLALYTYSFAAFLEPMLSENYAAAYLNGIAEDIREKGIAYRELYTKSYNALKASADKSVDKMLLGTTASALNKLGGFIKQTPIGDITPIDEAFEGAGKDVARFNKDKTRDLMAHLTRAKEPGVNVFRESVENINALHNKPHKLLADKDAIYILLDDEM